MDDLKSKIIKERLPQHVAIIMDGNGRWAKERGKTRVYGHRNGVRSVKGVVEACGEIGIKYLTLYTFSNENWKRPPTEVNALMDLLVLTVRKELNDLDKNNVKLKIIGDVQRIPSGIQEELSRALDVTENNTGLTLIMALSYSARWDMVLAIKSIAQKVKKGELVPNEIDDGTFKDHLATTGIPDPELLIRTSGEFRISNFLLWELAYSELFFCKKYWPDFSKEDFFGAILDYQRRERRFGKVSEQLKK